MKWILIAVLVSTMASSTMASDTPPADQQIAAAVLAAPAARRDGATVLGYDSSGATLILRQGSNDLVCLADNPGDDQFSVACYHESLEPYMARGRELRAAGVTGMERNTRRWEEIDAGRLEMPKQSATLYVLTGAAYDPASGEVEKSHLRWVFYLPHATGESTGLPTQPLPEDPSAPWLMFEGTAGAHIMVTPPRP